MERILTKLTTFFFLAILMILLSPNLKAGTNTSSWDNFPLTTFLSEKNMDCRQQDSLVLVELYNATGGANWTNTWDLGQSMDTWYGVALNAEGCVEVLDLDGNTNTNCLDCYGGGNQLTDTIPLGIWNLVHLKNLSFEGSFHYPLVLDSLPYFIDNLGQLEVLRLTTLNIQGSIPSSIGNSINLKILSLGNND